MVILLYHDHLVRRALFGRSILIWRKMALLFECGRLHRNGGQLAERSKAPV